MKVWVEPFTSVVDAVPFVNNEFTTVVKMFQMVCIASVELSREEGGLQNSKQEHKEEHDDLQVCDLWD